MALRVMSCAAIVAGAAAVVFSLPSPAQVQRQPNVIAAPDYGSGVGTSALSNSHFNTPESDGRPGVKFFTYGVQAFRKDDYQHAIDMYKIAASWAYKPAEYNLGVMYFKGQGIPVDRSLGAAWMVLAAERGDARYVQARDMMVTLLSKSEFARTDELWGQLQQTYGDKVALRRAKAQWALARTHQTGTRVGGATGELAVGVLGTGHTPVSLNAGGQSAKTTTTAAGMMQGSSIDGSVAYGQFQQSDNPYSAIFLKNRTGTVSVEPLQPVKPKDNKAKKDDRGSEGSSQPGQRPRSA